MGFTPQQVDACSFPQFAACVEGFNRANSPDEPAPPSNDEFDAFVAKLERSSTSTMVH
jgi:hypothetical protein